jgi:phosphonopyruvate decarboxylase
MISPENFYSILTKHGINFFAGVPDSLLKSICGYIADHVPQHNNIIAANEGNAVALACGFHMATGQLPMVYMQNSGIGNATNPLLSLADRTVYGIPLVILVGWRGEPGKKDEPQHKRQGATTLGLLDAMGITHEILGDSCQEADRTIERLARHARKHNEPVVIVVRKGTFSKYSMKHRKHTIETILTREDAIKTVTAGIDSNAVVISTTGKISRELFEFRESCNQSHQQDFLTVGSMGHANQIALGIALSKSNKDVYCFDGDGAILMHTGGLGIIGQFSPPNFKHILFNNGAHESVGGQPTVGFDVDFGLIAKGFGYKGYFRASTRKELEEYIHCVKECTGPVLLEVRVTAESRSDLGRPTLSPVDNKKLFMTHLG